MKAIATYKTYKCPTCGSEEVSVMCKVSCHPTEEGNEVLGNIIREQDDSAVCSDCEWTGVMGNLKLSPALN